MQHQWLNETTVMQMLERSKQTLRLLRKGKTVKAKGRTYVYKPLLRKGRDWKKIGNGIFYSNVAIENLGE